MLSLMNSSEDKQNTPSQCKHKNALCILSPLKSFDILAL